MRVEKTLIQTLTCQLSSTLMQLLFSFVGVRRFEKTLIQTFAYLSSTLTQLLFLFDQDMRIRKTLVQLLFAFHQDRVKRTLLKLSLVSKVPFKHVKPITSSPCWLQPPPVEAMCSRKDMDEISDVKVQLILQNQLCIHL